MHAGPPRDGLKRQMPRRTGERREYLDRKLLRESNGASVRSSLGRPSASDTKIAVENVYREIQRLRRVREHRAHRYVRVERPALPKIEMFREIIAPTYRAINLEVEGFGVSFGEQPSIRRASIGGRAPRN